MRFMTRDDGKRSARMKLKSCEAEVIEIPDGYRVRLVYFNGRTADRQFAHAEDVRQFVKDLR